MIGCSAKKRNFIFYDTETTGTNIEFDQILQFSAILVDQEFVELDRINVRCRRLPWVVPSPSAMLVTGVSPHQVDDPRALQFPEMMALIREKLDAWSPATFIGYNSFRFDEPLLQRALWQALSPPYVTVTNGNGRADLLLLARAASKLAPSALSIPNIASGRPTFKLDRLAPLNGFSHQRAHDALADTQAVIHISKIISSRVPKLWDSFILRSQKESAGDLLNSGELIYFVEPSNSGRPGWWGMAIGTVPEQRSTALVVRLDSDWKRFFSAEQSLQKDLAADLAFKPRRVKENMLPVTLTVSEALNSFGITPSKKEEVSAKLFVSTDRKSDVINLITQTSEKPEATILEQRIFEAFPSHVDEEIMRQFWALSWPERSSVIRNFEDPRFQQLAQRLIFVMAPQSLSASDQDRIRQSIRDRLLAAHSDKSLWRTIALARNEAEELRKFSTNDEALNEIVSWLSDLEKQ